MNEQPVINILGEKVALGPHRRDLVPLYQRWLNDFEVIATLGARLRPMTLESEGDWYERVSREQTDVVFVIYDRASMRPIGSTGLHDVDHLHGTAEFGILIGEKEFWNRGYGTETARLMLDHGFTLMGLNNIMLTVFDYNGRGIRAYTRAGFREFGRRRQARRLGGRRHDVVYMECLASEFESPLLHRLLPEDERA
jgi:RimJ/RimL family protein N-acetyltransferase